MYGLTEEEERDVLRLLKPFEEDKINEDEVETEELHFHYNTGNQPRIYNGIHQLSLLFMNHHIHSDPLFYSSLYLILP